MSALIFTNKANHPLPTAGRFVPLRDKARDQTTWAHDNATCDPLEIV
jgi:hypothetical protein